MKKAISLALTAAMALSLAACGGSGSTASSAASTETVDPSTASGTLKVMLSEEPTEGDAFSTVLHKWAEETGNEVEIMVIPYDDQLTKFPLMAKNKDLPDLISTTRLTHLYPDEFTDLSEYIDPAIFDQNALQIISQDYTSDRAICLPQQFTITNVFYNKTAFEAAGIEAPTVDDRWTMDEVYDAARKLQESGAVKYGMAMDASRARYDNLMYMNGGSLVEKDGDSFKVTVDSEQNIATLQAFIDANNEGILPKAIWAGGSSDNPGDYFKNGDVGIYFSGSWNYNTFRSDITSFEFGVMPSPVGSEGGSAILGGAGLAVPAEAAHRDLAVNFLQWFYTEDNFAYYLSLDKGLSGVKNVSYQPDDPVIAADYAVLQAETEQVSERFKVDESSEWRNYYDNEYRDALKQAVNGDLTAEAALNEFGTALAEKAGWAH
ncbi:MAG: sugar ABC transporter substrate-binding protein [bacterium]|nr:sugar ABC transporter substrate-binding protein [bacterium]MDD6718941.1 sugar ABC transporter substrate-binding protein [bacterium]